MKKHILILACAALLLLAGCAFVAAKEDAPPEGAYRVYYSAMQDEQAGAAVGWTWRVPASSGETAPALMAALLAGPEEPGLSSPFPAGVRLLSWSLDEGELRLDLSEQYGNLSGVDLTLADLCITLTFCQMEEVESVYITVEGREIPYRDTQVLRAGDVLLPPAEQLPVQ